MKNRNRLILGSLLLLLLLASILSACLGAVRISFAELGSIVMNTINSTHQLSFKPQQEIVLFSLRLPRIVLGILVGAGLGISGAAMQGLFRNPLAEPGLIGISSGASLFAVLMIVLEAKYFLFFSGVFGYYSLAVAAFIGACLTTFIVYGLAGNKGKTVITTLLLAGIAINALAGSFTGLLTFIANDDQLRNITFWSLGSLGGASWRIVTTLLPFILIPLLFLPFLSKSLNAIALGESQASHMGINIGRVKKLVIILATMTVGASVAVAGIIGFIGLVIPHILRMAVGSDHRLIVPGSAILGAVVLTLADLIARIAIAPVELPIGIITAIIGTPIFIYIIISERKKNYQ